MIREYPIKHGGCAIICGAAPSLFDDLKAARSLRPQATILGVKYSAALIPEIEHVWTQHGEFTRKIKAAAGRPIVVHARTKNIKSPNGGTWLVPCNKDDYAAIDYLWPSLGWAAGSSGVAGALWARHGMGFDEVIMAGITLAPGDTKYAKGYPNKYQNGVGYASREMVENWLRVLIAHQKEGKTDGIYSMSGQTQKILGFPP